MATHDTKTPARSEKGKGGIVLYSPEYYAACTLGGIIACGPTHTCKLLTAPLSFVSLLTSL